MTKRDYKLIAKAIRAVPDNNIKDNIINNLCLVLSTDNPRFNADEFRDMCTVEGNVDE